MAIDTAKANLTVNKKSDGPIIVQLQGIDVGSAGRDLAITGGTITADAKTKALAGGRSIGAVDDAQNAA